MPALPSIPGLTPAPPPTPAAPALPSVPAAPAAPSLPTVPSVPAVPALPAPVTDAAGAVAAVQAIPPLQRNLEITLDADTRLNTDGRDRSAPLMARIYLLKSAAAFQGADFFTIYERDQAALGADLLGKEEVLLRPGESVRLTIELKPDTRTIGVIGAYRELDRSTWRVVYALPQSLSVVDRVSGKPVSVPLRVRLGARDLRVVSP